MKIVRDIGSQVAKNTTPPPPIATLDLCAGNWCVETNGCIPKGLVPVEFSIHVYLVRESVRIIQLFYNLYTFYGLLVMVKNMWELGNSCLLLEL